LSDDIGGLV